MQIQTLGSIVEFDDDLIVFEKLRKKYQKAISEITAVVYKHLDTNKISESSEYIRNQYDFYANDIIREASKYGFYDKTIDDFVDYNVAYPKLITAYENFINYIRNVKEVTNHEVDISLQKAATQASSEISGLSWGIITGNVIDMFLYDCFNNSVIRRTTNIARKKYESESNSILKNAQNTINTTTKRYINETLKPQLQSGISELFTQLLAMHTQVLIACGKLNSHFLNGIDEKRSDSLLKNMNIVEDKSKLILQSINTCPYNVNSYISAYQNRIFDNSLLVLVKTFDLAEEFEPVALGINKLSTKNDLDLVSTYNQKLPYLEAFAFLNDISVNEVYIKLIQSTLKRRKSDFEHLQLVCKSYTETSIYSYFTKYGEKADYNLSEKFSKVVRLILSREEYEFLISTIDYNPLHDLTGEKCSSYDDFMQFEDAEYKNIEEKYNKRVKELIDYDNAELEKERKKENERKNKEHNKEVVKKVAKIVVIIIAIALLLLFIRYIINDYQVRDQEQKAYQAYIEEISSIPDCHLAPFANIGFSTSKSDIIDEFGSDYKKTNHNNGAYEMLYTNVNIFGLEGNLEVNLTKDDKIYWIRFVISHLDPDSKAVYFYKQYFTEKYPDVTYEGNGNISWDNASGKYITMFFYEDGRGEIALFND